VALDRHQQLRRLSEADQLITNAETAVTKQIRTMDVARADLPAFSVQENLHGRLPVRPNVGATLAAEGEGELVFDVRDAQLIRPAVSISIQ